MGNLMNDQMREWLRIELAKRDMSQSDLARALDKSPQYLNKVIKGQTAQMPDVWQEILEKFDAAIVVVSKEKE